ncbi:hypothetical protein SLE2022_103010 [Rubroshorea leprosula]
MADLLFLLLPFFASIPSVNFLYSVSTNASLSSDEFTLFAHALIAYNITALTVTFRVQRMHGYIRQRNYPIHIGQRCVGTNMP